MKIVKIGNKEICVNDELYNAICKTGKEEIIAELKDKIREIYKCQFYCMADMCDKEEPTASMCIDCFYDAISKLFENIEAKEIGYNPYQE